MPPAHTCTLVRYVCVCVCVSFVPRRCGNPTCPSCAGVPDRSDEEARSEKRRGIVRRRQKPSALYYLRIHIGRRGKEQAHSLTSFARKKKKRTDRTTLLRHVYTLSPITPGYVRSHTYTYIRIYIFTCEHSSLGRGCPNGCRRTWRMQDRSTRRTTDAHTRAIHAPT